MLSLEALDVVTPRGVERLCRSCSSHGLKRQEEWSKGLAAPALVLRSLPQLTGVSSLGRLRHREAPTREARNLTACESVWRAAQLSKSVPPRTLECVRAMDALP